LVPPTTRALPENETLSAAASLAQACALCIFSRREPRAPFNVTVPPNVAHPELVKLPTPNPFSVLLPMSRPRPDIAPLPKAFLPFT
jgi:hypothetical protein